MKVGLISLALIVLSAAVASAAAPLKVELLEVKKIWDQAPHNAFTDLVRWNEHFYCAFREGRGHVSTDGRIRVLRSRDADTWSSTGLIALDGYDLRDA
ncbi:MAG: exo-alpha-sialidase, partial [Planctomycetes bacterium]|nr:exo-alpha-sialidase [Planctomycetota bacterium]